MFVSIVRSGDILSEAARRLAIGCSTGKILVQRDESDPDKRPTYYYHKLPKNIASKQVLLCDPMLATGGSAIAAIGKLIIDAGVQEENILFLNVVACPKGIITVYKKYPKVRIVTAAIDKDLNSRSSLFRALGILVIVTTVLNKSGVGCYHVVRSGNNGSFTVPAHFSVHKICILCCTRIWNRD